MWSCAVRTPPLYPDAITLRPGVRADEILARIDATAGGSVKDSYADVELGSFGFRVLVHGTWMVYEKRASRARPAPEGWSFLARPAEFAQWERAWRADGPGDILLPALLDVPNVAVVGRLVDVHVVAGAVVHHTDATIGLSNVFFLEGAAQTWTPLVALVRSRWSERPIVGYEHGPSLNFATDAGFEPIGDLRIWVRDW